MSAQETVMPSFTNVKYGEYEKELINFWLSESEEPLGVLLSIHGGGWMGGGKKETMVYLMKLSNSSNYSKDIILFNIPKHGLNPDSVTIACKCWFQSILKD